MVRPLNPIGECPLCHRSGVKIKKSAKLEGGHGCNRCYKAAQRKERRRVKKAVPTEAPRSAPAPAAPKPPPPEPIAQQRGTGAAGDGPRFVVMVNSKLAELEAERDVIAAAVCEWLYWQRPNERKIEAARCLLSTDWPLEG